MASDPIALSWTDSTTPLTAIASHRIAALAPENTLLEAVRLLAQLRTSSLLVLDADHHPLGILTERCLLQALHTSTPPQTILREIMAAPVTVPADISCMAGYQRCLREDVRHLVLVDEAQRAVAVVSETDFRRHLDLDVQTGQTRICSIMNRSFFTLEPDAPLQTALKRMHTCMTGVVIVVNEQHIPVGILTERDLTRLYLADLQERDNRTLAHVMTTPVRTVAMDASLAEAAAAMIAHWVRQYPVVDPSGALVGLLTARKLNQAMAFALMETSLDQEQANLRQLLEQAPFPLLITRIDTGQVCYVNTRAENQFQVTKEDLIDQPVLQFYRDPDDRKRLLDQLRQKGHVYDQELMLADTNGRPFTALISSSVIEYDHQPALLSAINDITQRKQNEQELLFRNILLTTQQEASIDGILVVDEHDQVLSFNRRFAEMWRLPDEILQSSQDSTLLAFVASQVINHDAFVQRVRTLYSQPRQTSRETILLTDNRVFDRYTAPMFGDDQHYFGRVWFFRDITEQEQAAQHLRHERAKLQGLFQALPEPLWVKDPEGRYLMCNPAFERLYGAKAADIIGKTDYDFVTKELADFFHSHDQKAVALGRPMVNEEWLAFADGSQKSLCESVKTSLQDEAGALIGVLGLARDITQRRREQRDLRERIKEQQCLYRIFALTEDVTVPFAEQLQHVVAQISAGWQHSEITEARIVVDGTVYATPGFRESEWLQTVEATTQQKTTLQLTVAYLESRPAEDEGPFLVEERQLAEAVIHRLAEVAERRHALASVEARDQLIAAMFAQTTDAIVLVDAQTNQFVDFNTAAHTGLGYASEEFARLRVEDIQAELSAEQISTTSLNAVLGKRISFETQHRHKNGSLRDVALTLRPITLGERPLVSAVWRDITEQKARERALAESEKRLKTITDSALDAILMLDDAGNISYWNPAAETIFGYQSEEALGRNLHQLIALPAPHAGRQPDFSLFREAGESRAIGKTIELAARRKDGAKITISLSLSSVQLNDQWHAVGIVRDISELKQHQAALESALEEAETATRAANEVLIHLEELVQARTAELNAVNEQLRFSEERYTLALDAATDGLWDWNMVTGEMYCSPAYYRMLGYEPGELASELTSNGSLVHPDDREQVSAAVRRLLAEQGSIELEFRMTAKNGETVWVLNRGKVVSRAPDGQPLRAVGIHTDLTSRKQIETALRIAAKEQQAIFNAAGMGIFLVRNRVVIRCNRKLEEFFGYGPGELLGKSSERWYRTHEEYLQWGQRIATDIQTSGIFQAELQLQRKDGSLFWVRTTAQALDRSDLSKGLVGMLDDITPEREASEALRRAKEDAEAATRAKSEFLANMSHEIRTPLNAILGFAHLMQHDPLTPQQRNQLEKLSKASRHLLHVINDILDISKIEANKMTLDIGEFEPARAVDQVFGIISDKAAAKKLQLLVDLDHIPLMVRGDGARLGQILLNLVGNAVKFTEQGQVKLTARILLQESDRIILRFEVRDTGIGMAEDQVARIFLPFEQADSSTTRRYGGTGLGLAISKRLTDLMGGRIGVESQLGAGTLFWIELPFAPSTQAPKVRAQGEAIQGKRALVIDDSPESREIMASMLEEIGMHALATASGEDGLRKVLEADRAGQPFALLVVDWRLNGIDGISAMEQLQALELTSRPALLLATAYSDDLPRNQAVRAGISKIITKPVTPSMLFDAIVETILPAALPQEADRAEEQAPHQRRGAKILLAEDNPINQEVAQMLLESMGMEVTVADNGKAAVDLVEQQAFDLVFMDMQMPVMDGLEATRAIRRTPGRQNTPILAMTANAFSEDREHCLEAGMNDHLAKPIELHKLQTLLTRWLPARQQQPLPDIPSSEPPDAPPADRSDIGAQLQRIDGLDVATSLRRLLGDHEVYLRLLTQFVQLHGEDGSLLAASAEAKDWRSLRHQAHALKGAAGVLGAWNIAQQAAILEQLVRERCEEATVRALIDELQPTLQALCVAITRVAANNPVAEWAAPVDHQQTLQAQQALAQMEALLAIEDSAVNDVLAAHRPLLLAAFGAQAQLLGSQIESFDYADALATIRSLLHP